MNNPVRAAWDYLRGRDLDDVAPLEQKTFTWSDPGALITPPTQIISGPAQFMLANPYANTSDGNSAVFSCLVALAKAHIEAPIRAFRGDPESGTAKWLADSPLQALLSNPNPQMTAEELWWWTCWAKHTDGNAYLRKVRSGDPVRGNVLELWPISPRLIKPMTNPGSDNLIDYYRYSYAPGKWEDIPTANVIHFRLGLDDTDLRLGLSPVKRLVREIASDQAATAFSDALLRNFGVPGLVVTTPMGSSVSDEQAEALKSKLENRFGAENRGNVGILTAGATLAQFGFSPDQLNLKELHDFPETRIAAVMGVHPAVAGLGVGLEQSANFASLKQVREGFTELSIIPEWRMDAATFNAQLKPDFTNEPDVRIAYDLSKVRALQEDRTQLFTRLDNAVRTGWVMPNEARAEVGLEPLPGGDQPLPKPAFAAGAVQPLPLPSPKANERVIELKSGELTPSALQALVELATPAMADELERFFDGQRKRVIRSLTAADRSTEHA